ncbi:MAG: phage portal protein [Ruminococcaceae bacterium]|nr:phage portal protein [Oscillospiraceae bacterium]
MKGFTARSGSPNEDINYNNYTLRQRGRMLYMSSPIASSAINTTRTKAVGMGLHMKSAINRTILGLSEEEAKKWEKMTEAEFNMWAKNKQNCDALGLNNFYGLQQLAILSWLMSGDVFALFTREASTLTNPHQLRIHLIEADRISTPTGKVSTTGFTAIEGRADNGNKIFDGVEINSRNKAVAYYIRNTYPYQAAAEQTEWQRVATIGEKTGMPNILHIMNAERPDQYRGVTYLAQAIEPILQLRRYTESELMAALIQTYFTAWVETEAPTSDIPFAEVGAGSTIGAPNGESDDLSEDESEYEMGPGTTLHLQPGEKVNFGNPTMPTAGFETFTKTNEKMIGAGMEIPYDVLMKEFNSSYSAAKGALEEVWEAIKMRRSWLVDDFCQPVYERWLAEAVALGRIKAPGFFNDPLVRDAWCGARWDGPAQTHLDPLKEANANAIAVDRGWKTNEQVTREHYGGDWTDNAERRKQEDMILPPPASQTILLQEEGSKNAE